MKSKNIVGTTIFLITVIVVFIVWRQLFSQSVVKFRPSDAAGEVLADEVSRLLGGKGEVVVVAPATVSANNANGECLASFVAALQHRGTIKLGATVTIPHPPTPTLNWNVLQPEQLLDVMDKDSGVNALVIFTTLPSYSTALADKLKAHSLTLVAVGGYDGNVRRWLESHALALTVVPRITPSVAGAFAPKTAREWFDSEYQLVTPENVGSLPNSY
jgi:hypothetical protein